MGRLILVRHSLPDINPAKPAYQWKLSAEGRERCKLVAEKVSIFQPEIIVSSAEIKARETAETLGDYLSFPVQVAEGLHEHERANEPYLESQEQFRQKIRELFLNPDHLVYGSETASQALARVTRAIQLALDSSPGRNLLVVSHGTVIALFVASFNAMNGYDVWRTLKMPDWIALNSSDFSLLHPKR